ncbi:MAG TPA: DedA family protein [Tepidisphaeraceae bacterium]|nr:DedA family protein [Tepidisphaeraceae bacterium]
MGEWATSMINSMGYVGIVFLMFLENVFPPIPSEVIMPAAGFTAARGQLNLYGVIAAGALGSVLGAIPLYYLGYFIGEARLKRWAARHGHWLAVSEEDVGKADAWFNKHRGKAVLIGRLVPGIRSLISIPAGVNRMSLPTFLLYTAIGSTAWSAVLAVLGKLLEAKYDRVQKWVDPITYAVLGIMVVSLVVRAVRIKRRAKQKEAGAGSA